ncbi:hypothetical protein NE237_022026 [Protea cynaroides]|uniref:Uncharacterized protein n=1 Tax=Protea cynaroides TaxID=273540 RepID=A0A9Q0K3U3_9MAGN|nr:hypothetical protein NE237_022026 [Protea cynaroides]
MKKRSGIVNPLSDVQPLVHDGGKRDWRGSVSLKRANLGQFLGFPNKETMPNLAMVEDGYFTPLVDLKFEHHSGYGSSYGLPYDWEVLNNLSRCYEIPWIHYKGWQGDYYILVLEKIGPNLWDVGSSNGMPSKGFTGVNQCGQVFSFVLRLHVGKILTSLSHMRDDKRAELTVVRISSVLGHQRMQ